MVAPKNEIGLSDILRPFAVGIVSVLFVNPEFKNALSPTLVTELGIVTDVNEEHDENASSSIVVTEFGIVIDVNPEPENTA